MDCEITNNRVDDYGTKKVPGQGNGIQIGEGTGGLCWGNRIANGNGNGILVVGLGDNVIERNTIINAGENGIFCDDRVIKGKAFYFNNNVIINPKGDGFRIYAEGILNILKHNVVIAPGTLGLTTRSKNDSYIFKLSKKVDVSEFNNHFSTDQGLATYYINL